MTGRLDGRVIAVTGGAGGIGQGIARAIVEAGGRAGLIDLDGNRVEKAAQTLDPSGETVIGLAADVTDRASMDAALGALRDRFGRFDGLVNNAGIVRLGPATEMKPADFDAEYAVNVKGVLVAAQAAAALMAGKGGAIVNVASNAGKVGYPNMAGYNASKAAVINLTRSLSLEWAADRINVNAVCPGGVATDMLGAVADFISEKSGTDRNELFGSMVPAQLGRHIEPVEVGRVIAFLLGDAAQIIRGQAITIDGGDTPY
ncbi:SDR family NAD(P)-dependent oxidoreductase [Roseitalea porphyridii]|uniref:SDR family oxidoreductase n=1 Tax=Roseitalea porphyridii TaxID=1852022 RepID=A0A4P6V357_9HYPH|nr:SDR family NAD(P)-dependent oxidoreductase [Roseitalea porphyridii]QBK31149.1 SDR family oxidoreductase [Roseitalea porphyridii]